MRKISRLSFSKLETGNSKLTVALICSIAFLCVCNAVGQPVTGTPPLGSFAGGPDVIDLSNLNVHWSFPVFSKAGHGIPFNYGLTYDSSIWQVAQVNGQPTWQPVGGLNPTWGWKQQGTPVSGYVTYSVVSAPCPQYPYPVVPFYFDWSYVDTAGTSHLFGLPVYGGTCSPSTLSGPALDNSGYQMAVSAVPSAIVYTPAGGKIVAPLLNQNASGTFTVTDNNGN